MPTILIKYSFYIYLNRDIYSFFDSDMLHLSSSLLSLSLSLDFFFSHSE